MNVLIFAIFDIKIKYNNNYKIVIMNVDKKIFIKLHYKYYLSKFKNVKFSNQKIKSFIIFIKYEKFIYKLNFSKI